MPTLCAMVLAFSLPAFHLAFVKDKTVIELPVDLTLDQCLAMQRQYLPRAHAICMFRPGQRELT